MKVCVTFHNDIFTPWPATSIIHPVEVLLAAGHDVTVFSWDKGRNVKLNEATLPVTRKEVKVPVTGFRSLFEFSAELSDALVAESPALILAFDLEVLSGSEKAARRLGIPLLYFAREDWPAMVRGEGTITSLLRSLAFASMEKRICRRNVEHVYSINPERGEKFRRWSLPYTTIYTTRALAELPEMPEKHSEFTVAIAGSMLEMGALPSVMKALNGIDCRLRLIGGDEKNIAATGKIVEGSGMEDRIDFTGHLPSLADYYTEIGKCHLGLTLPLNTDRNKYLGISVKMWDYMAMGLPQVVSNFPAMASIVSGDGKTRIGMTADPLSVEELHNNIIHYVRDPSEAASSGSMARRLFVERYCWERQREELMKSHQIFRASAEKGAH